MTALYLGDSANAGVCACAPLHRERRDRAEATDRECFEDILKKLEKFGDSHEKFEENTT